MSAVGFRIHPPHDEAIAGSPYGYWIGRDGTVYVLTEMQSHGKVVAAIDPKIWEAVRAEVDGDLDPESRSIGTKCDLAGVRLGWIRVGISRMDGSISVNWDQDAATTHIQKRRLAAALDAIDPDDEEELWHDRGTCRRRELMAMIKAV